MLTFTLNTKLKEKAILATNPHPLIKDEGLQHKARLLASLTLALVPLHVLVSFVLYSVYGAKTWSWRVVLVSGVATFLIYVISRTRFIRIGVNAFIAEMMIIAVTLLYINADAYSAVSLLLPIYFASMFRSLKRLILVSTVTIASAYVMSQLLLGDWVQIYGVLALLIVTSTMVVIRAHLQWQAEAELRLRNQQLAESEARFRAAIDASIGVFYLLKEIRDAEGKIQDFMLVDVNTQVAQQFGQDYSTLVNHPISAVIPADYFQQLFSHCEHVLNNGTPYITEVESPIGWWDYQIVPMPDGVAVIGFDINSRKDAEQRRVELQAERERVAILQRFISDMSHDLMTPLSIIGSSSYLAGKVPEPERRAQHLKQITHQTERLKNMFEDMLTQSRMDNLTREELEHQSADMSQLLEKLVASYTKMAEFKAQQLNLEVTGEAAALVDATAMEVALGNVIDNALKYTPEGGVIRVLCESGPESITVTIEDNGIGIPLSEMALIFERFYRVEAHRPLTAGGGLGLSITKRVVDLHGGSIMAENRAEGGMRFKISLPKTPVDRANMFP